MLPKKKGKKKKNPPVESLLVDTAMATGRGLGSKRPDQQAVNFWAKKYKTSFARELSVKPNWEKDRPKVLRQALKLGRKARQLAGTSKTITKAIAKKASKAIAVDPFCVPQPGSGRYCPPGA